MIKADCTVKAYFNSGEDAWLLNILFVILIYY